MESGLLLDIVVRKGSSVFELLSSEDKSLLIRGDTFLVLDLSLDVFDGVRRLNIEGNSLTSQGLDEDLHTTSKSQDQMESRLLLDVVVREGSAVFQLLSSEDESLLIRRDTFLVLDLSLDVFDGIRGFNIKSDGLAGEGLDEDLHTTSKSKDQVKSGFLLNIVVRKGSSVFKLLTSEDKSLLIRRDTFLVLDLGLDVLNGVRRLNIEGDGLAGEGLNEDLHLTR